jgi:hypothetical protein
MPLTTDIPTTNRSLLTTHPTTTYHLLPTTYYLLPTHYYLLNLPPTTFNPLPTAHYLLLTTDYLLLTTYYLLLTTYHSGRTTHYSLRTTHYSLLSLTTCRREPLSITCPSTTTGAASTSTLCRPAKAPPSCLASTRRCAKSCTALRAQRRHSPRASNRSCRPVDA